MEISQPPRLFEHGIHTEKSDIRVHVGVSMRTIFVFKTKCALAALDAKQYPRANAKQPGVMGITATGYLVPPADISDMQRLKPQSDYFIKNHWLRFSESDSTSKKGKLAVAFVCEIMRLGRFPLWLNIGDETRDKEIQIEGTDIILMASRRVQVKCDWFAGDTRKSGCLYLQTAERNPLKMV